MRSIDVVVAHSDRNSAHKLANSLHDVFRSVQVVASVDELRAIIARRRACLIISDLETIDFNHVEALQREFGIAILCTHRIPDEGMWAEALSRGAIDCCHTSDIPAILQAVNRNLARSHAA